MTQMNKSTAATQAFAVVQYGKYVEDFRRDSDSAQKFLQCR